MTNSTALTRELLGLGHRVRIRTVGTSMYPHIRFGEVIHIQHAAMSDIAIGHIAVYAAGSSMVAHRVIRKGIDGKGPFLLTKGDSFSASDAPVRSEQVLGRVAVVERNGRCLDLDSPSRQALNRFYALISPFSSLLYPLLWRARRAAMVVWPFRIGVVRQRDAMDPLDLPDGHVIAGEAAKT